ncbi:methyltransferase [Streptomyces sp. NPDC059881]|uniref:methyltransferase n=1 Tax=Streptomyces sp. NPDC059881 TaxID=3346986 RepID=UPI00365A4461
MRAHRSLHTVLVDLPGPVAATTARMAVEGFGNRFTPVAGSFFDPLPTGADVYALVNVIHNWSDEQAATILRRCAEAGREDSTFVIVERLMDDTDPRAITVMDLRMFLLLGGRERTASQIIKVASSAGLAHQSTFKPCRGLHVLVFRKERS